MRHAPAIRHHARHRGILALVLASPVLVVAACGSHTGGGGSAEDGGAPSEDAATLDATVDAPALQDSGAATDAASALEDSGAATDAGPPACPAPYDGGPFVTATHGQLPTMAYRGEGILQAPQIITFTFPTTAGASALAAFGQTLTQTPWFAEVSKDYCINDGGTCIRSGAAGLSVAISSPAAPTYVDLLNQADGGASAPDGGVVDLDAFIREQIASAVAATTIPAPGPDSLYVFYFPESTTIYQGGDFASPGAPSCTGGFYGYHSTLTYSDGTTQIPYAIVADCKAESGWAGEVGLMTATASSVIMGAVTDTIFGHGWYLDLRTGTNAPTLAQLRNDPWASMGFSEVGNNCQNTPNYGFWLDSGALVQRMWSTSAAAAGQNPCVPVPAGETYYNASPDRAIYVADVGTTFTVDISGFTDVPRDSWELFAVDGTPSATSYLSLAFVGGVDGGVGRTTLPCDVNNQTKAQLQVTLLADPASGGLGEADGVLFSDDVMNEWTPSGGPVQVPYQVWPFAVVTPAEAAELGITDAGVTDNVRPRELRPVSSGPSLGAMPGKFVLRR